MASVKFDLPKGTSNEELYSCLTKLIDELEYILCNLSSDNMDGDTAVKIESISISEE